MRFSAPVVVLLVGLAARAAFAVASGISGPPVEDERGYALLAESLARGDGFALPLPEPFASEIPRTAFRAPLLPILLAPLSACGGGILAFRLLSIVLGACAAPLLYVSLRGVVSDRAAWIASLLLALWPAQIYLSVRVLSEPLATALVLGSVAVSVSGGESAQTRLFRRDAVAGGLLGLAILARPAVLLVAVLLVASRCGVRRIAVCGVTLLLVVAPWVARNWAAHGRPLLTTNSGVTLVGANSRAALDATHPGKWLAPHDVYRGAVDAPDLGMWGWSSLGEEASDRRFTADALRFVREEPLGALRLAAWKLVRFADPDTHSAKDDAAWKRIAGWCTWAPALLLAVVGVVRLRRGDASLRPFVAILLGTLATTLVFYADGRMRSAADPAVLALAALGLDTLIRSRSDRSQGR